MTPPDSAHPEFSPPAPTHFAVQSGPVRLAATAWGDPAQPVVVLVHGYPDNSHVWHGVAQALAGRFRVVAYDVRGAGASDVPADMVDYRLERLADDFIAVVDAVSPDRPVHLVGHDWGSIQGWEFVTDPRLYGRIASFTSCSGPCLDHAARALREPPRHWGATLRQALASWFPYSRLARVELEALAGTQLDVLAAPDGRAPYRRQPHADCRWRPWPAPVPRQLQKPNASST